LKTDSGQELGLFVMETPQFRGSGYRSTYNELGSLDLQKERVYTIPRNVALKPQDDEKSPNFNKRG